jgi:hypothetical protein
MPAAPKMTRSQGNDLGGTFTSDMSGVYCTRSCDKTRPFRCVPGQL